jgi:hypothetical protein
MPNYQKGKIYKLWSPSKNLVYYGSTVQTISLRLLGHLSKKKDKTYNCSSFVILDCDDYKIELVEEYPCNNRQELMKKEGEYIKNNDCVNKYIAGRTKMEYDKIKYHKNREALLIKRKKYHQENKEKEALYSKNWSANNRDRINNRKKILYETKKQNNAIYKWLLMTGIIV